MAALRVCETRPRAREKKEEQRVGASSESARPARKFEAAGKFTGTLTHHALARSKSFRKSAIDSARNKGPYLRSRSRAELPAELFCTFPPVTENLLRGSADSRVERWIFRVGVDRH